MAAEAAAVVTDAQVRRLMSELGKHGKIGLAAMKAGMDRKTARKHRDLGCVPSDEPKARRTWKTRADPFAEDWADIETKLTAAPELEATTLLEDLMARRLQRSPEPAGVCSPEPATPTSA